MADRGGRQPLRKVHVMKPACQKCGQVHHPQMARAVGRFDPKGTHGYQANYQDAPHRHTRDEAITDMCKWLTSNQRKHTQGGAA